MNTTYISPLFILLTLLLSPLHIHAQPKRSSHRITLTSKTTSSKSIYHLQKRLLYQAFQKSVLLTLQELIPKEQLQQKKDFVEALTKQKPERYIHAYKILSQMPLGKNYQMEFEIIVEAFFLKQAFAKSLTNQKKGKNK